MGIEKKEQELEKYIMTLCTLKRGPRPFYKLLITYVLVFLIWPLIKLEITSLYTIFIFMTYAFSQNFNLVRSLYYFA